jgi:hypothetical protein
MRASGLNWPEKLPVEIEGDGVFAKTHNLGLWSELMHRLNPFYQLADLAPKLVC